MAFCKECSHWKPTTYDPKNEHIGVCQLDGKEKDDIRYGCVFYDRKRTTFGMLKPEGKKY